MRLLSIASALLLVAVAAAYPQPANLSGTIYTKHFIIRHHPNSKAAAQTLGEASELWYEEINKRLEITEPGGAPIPMFVYRNQREFTNATGYERPRRVLGRASTEGYIDLDSSGVFAPAGQIAGHEIVHVLIFRILGKNAKLLPLWVNEGTAKLLTDDWDIVDRSTLADAITQGGLIPLSKLDYRFPEGQQETLAYAQSASAVAYFVDTYGEPSLAGLIHRTTKVRSFERAMVEVTGISVEEFERGWLKSIEGRRSVLYVIRIAAIIGVIAMPILVIAAYITFRRRKQRLIAQYEQDEWEEANWRDWGGKGPGLSAED